MPGSLPNKKTSENLRSTSQTGPPIPQCLRTAYRHSVVTPPPIWRERAFRQRPQATNDITSAVQEVRRICKKKAILMQAGCVCQQEGRYWLAAVAHTCHRAKIPAELAKLYVSGPQILNKNGPRIVAGKWAQNLGHTPGFCFKFKQGPFLGHEIVAKKWAHNLDRLLTKNKPRTTNLDVDWPTRPVRGPPLKAVSLMPQTTLRTQMGQE